MLYEPLDLYYYSKKMKTVRVEKPHIVVQRRALGGTGSIKGS